MSIDRREALDRVLGIGREAAAGIARIYAGAFAVEYKGKDDPVTRADREANTLICAELARAYPGVPIVAEESDPASYAGFSQAPCAWFVDPLDGTRDFVARNGEFAVMIGLAEAGRAVLGVLVLPALRRSLVGAEGVGAFEVAAGGARVGDPRERAHGAPRRARPRVAIAAVVPEEEAKLAELGLVPEPCGSAGVKGARVACGEADLYAQVGNAGKLWDSCAPEAIVRAAGRRLADGLRRALRVRASRSSTIMRGVVAGNGALVAQIVAARSRRHVRRARRACMPGPRGDRHRRRRHHGPRDRLPPRAPRRDRRGRRRPQLPVRRRERQERRRRARPVVERGEHPAHARERADVPRLCVPDEDQRLVPPGGLPLPRPHGGEARRARGEREAPERRTASRRECSTPAEARAAIVPELDTDGVVLAASYNPGRRRGLPVALRMGVRVRRRRRKLGVEVRTFTDVVGFKTLHGGRIGNGRRREERRAGGGGNDARDRDTQRSSARPCGAWSPEIATRIARRRAARTRRIVTRSARPSRSSRG